MTDHSMPAPRVRTVLAAIAIAVLLLGVLGTFRRGLIKAGKASVPEASAAGLPTRAVTRRRVPASVEVTGTVQAERIATLASRVVANVVELRASAGRRVSAGEVLVVLDDRELRHRVQQAKEAVAGAEAALAQARSDYRRDKPVFEQKGLSAYAFEHTETNLRTAEAACRRLQEAEREAEVDLSYAQIRSPFAGIVVDRQANLGDQASPGKPLVTLYQEGRFWLEASVPEERLSRIRRDQAMTLRIDALGREMRGRVAELVPSADPSSRSVLVRVRLEDARDVLPGMFGRLRVPLGEEERTLVPAQAVIRAGQVTLADVVREGRVERRAVQLGAAVGDDVEVLSGLAPGEAVVVGKGR